MKNITLLILLAFSFVSCAKEEVKKTDDTAIYSENELEILDLINKHRSSIGKPALVMDEDIYNIAKQHSINMAKKSVEFGHGGFEDRVEQMMEIHGKGASAENVAYGYKTPKGVVEGWLKSEGHRKNIEGDYTVCGIAIAESSDGEFFYTHLFFKPL